MAQQGIETDLAIDWLKSLEGLLVTKNFSSHITLQQGLIQALTEITKAIGDKH